MKPLLHEHLYDPIVLVQFALESQLFPTPSHSLISVDEMIQNKLSIKIATKAFKLN